jgi:hypothetical protein
LLKIVICCYLVTFLWGKTLSVDDDEVALDLSCERCARVYLAIFGNDRVSWLEKIIRNVERSRQSGIGPIRVFHDRRGNHAR